MDQFFVLLWFLIWIACCCDVNLSPNGTDSVAGGNALFATLSFALAQTNAVNVTVCFKGGQYSNSLATFDYRAPTTRQFGVLRIQGESDLFATVGTLKIAGSDYFTPLIADELHISNFIIVGNAVPSIRVGGRLTLNDVRVQCALSMVNAFVIDAQAIDATRIVVATSDGDAEDLLTLQASYSIAVRGSLFANGLVDFDCADCGVALVDTLFAKSATFLYRSDALELNNATFVAGAVIDSRSRANALTIGGRSFVGNVYGALRANEFTVAASTFGCSQSKSPLLAALSTERNASRVTMSDAGDVVHPTNCSIECACNDCSTQYDGLVGCFRCAAGYVGSDDYSRCMLCPAGTYLSLHRCQPCGDGFVSQADRATCRQCASGATDANHTACLPCDVGSYETLLKNGMPACVDCGATSFAQLLGGQCPWLTTTNVVALAALVAFVVVLCIVGVVVKRKCGSSSRQQQAQKHEYAKLLNDDEPNNSAVDEDNFFSDGPTSVVVNKAETDPK